MAFRIHDSVIRGEIDNRVKGIVRGKIWIEGRPEPVFLELNGNAWPDLAGCLLTFINPLKRIPHPHLDALNSIQRGCIGDLTASRKVRVFDVPVEQAYTMAKRGEKAPEHMANCLYLEWFSEANGRVVVESTDYELTISPPQWHMTPEEEQDRARAAAAAMDAFMNRLTEAIETHQRGQKDPEEDWDEHDYEKFLKECDARTDKFGELLDKYGHSEEAQDEIAKQIGWGEGDDEDVDEDEQQAIDELNAMSEAAENDPLPESDPQREGIDWIRTSSGDIVHPLYHRCSESAFKFWRTADALGLKESADQDLEQFLFEFQTTSAKLSGALNSIARGAPLPDPAFTVALLKRALDHLHKSQAGLEALTPKKLLPDTTIADARQELFDIRAGILRLMDNLRGR